MAGLFFLRGKLHRREIAYIQLNIKKSPLRHVAERYTPFGNPEVNLDLY